MRAPAIVAVTLLIAASTAAAARDDSAQRLQKQLAGLVPGQPTNCVSRFPSDQSETYDGAVLYHSGSTTYVNRFGGSCHLRPDFDVLVTSTPTTQLCRGDTAQVIDSASHIQHDVCIYGDFETYTRPKKAK